MNRLKLTIYPLAALGIVMAAGGCSKQEQDPRTETQLVRTIPAEPAPGDGRSFTGVVSARVESDLGFRVSGKVIRRLVDAGQYVHAGQPLMQIDRTDYALAINAQTGNVEAAKARALQADADEQRYRGLVSTGAVSASTYDQVKAAADAANAQLAAAEAQEKTAKDAGDYSILVADASGVVVDTLAEPGQVVAAGQTVIKLAHSGPREASVNLPETVRPALGSTAYADLYGTDNAKNVARLRQLSDAADPQTRTFEARYVLEGPAAKAPLGATVTVRLAGEAASDVLEVPVASIFDRGKGPGIWAVNRFSSTVSFLPLQVRHLGEEVAEVSGNLQPGQDVVALGVHLLHDGQQVRVEQEKEAIR